MEKTLNRACWMVIVVAVVVIIAQAIRFFINN